MNYLLDTSIAIHLRDDNEKVMRGVGELGPYSAISALTQVELEGGVFTEPLSEERRRNGLALLLATFEVIAFTSVAAVVYGKIVAQTGFSRRKIVDRMIAATAMVNDMTLITTNGADFADIDGLKLEVWTID